MSGDSTFSILAIDPGITGALAVYRPSDHHLYVFDMPEINGKVDPHTLSRLIKQHSPTVAVIENVGPMPRDGVRQAWRFSAANTTACVVCALLELPTSFVSPAKWKSSYGVKGGPEGKDKCRALAIQIFPAVASLFERKKDAGRAEAALLAYLAAEKFQNSGMR